jgi:acyl-coenzyme A thioesterase PaaI-like protein
MDATAIPFSRLLGLRRNIEGDLELPFTETVHNHLGSVHASAQIALAETASGDLLARAFPELADQVIPVMREVKAKFRSPAASTLTARASLPKESSDRFLKQFEAKGRASVSVDVEVFDAQGELTCRASFDWFVHKR